MSKIDREHLNQLVTRFKAYKSPNDTQQLIIELGSKPERYLSTDDNKKLSILLRAEKKADELMKARAATQRLMNTENLEKRKVETRKKVIWGAALKTASKNDAEVAQMMHKLFNSAYIADKDKDAVRADYDALATPDNTF